MREALLNDTIKALQTELSLYQERLNACANCCHSGTTRSVAVVQSIVRNEHNVSRGSETSSGSDILTTLIRSEPATAASTTAAATSANVCWLANEQKLRFGSVRPAQMQPQQHPQQQQQHMRSQLQNEMRFGRDRLSVSSVSSPANSLIYNNNNNHHHQQQYNNGYGKKASSTAEAAHMHHQQQQQQQHQPPLHMRPLHYNHLRFVRDRTSMNKTPATLALRRQETEYTPSNHQAKPTATCAGLNRGNFETQVTELITCETTASSSNIAITSQHQQQQQAATMMEPSVASSCSPSKSAIKQPQQKQALQQVDCCLSAGDQLPAVDEAAYNQARSPLKRILSLFKRAKNNKNTNSSNQSSQSSPTPTQHHSAIPQPPLPTQPATTTNNFRRLTSASVSSRANSLINNNNNHHQQQQYNNGFGKKASSTAVAEHMHHYRQQQQQPPLHMRPLHYNHLRDRPSMKTPATLALRRQDTEYTPINHQAKPMAQPVPTNNNFNNNFFRRSISASVIGATSSSVSVSSSKSASVMHALQQPTTINNNNKHVQFAATLSQTLPQNDIRASELHDEVKYDARSTISDDDDDVNSEYI